MQIILNNDNVLHGFESAQSFTEEVLKKALKGKAKHLSRVEIWVADENGPKGGPDDKRCSMEARPKGKKPIGVHHNAADISAAIRGAADKLARRLERELS